MNKEQEKKIIAVFKSNPAVKLGYFFGSREAKEAGPMSDYDFAVYFDGIGRKKMMEEKFLLQNEISRILKEDKVDLVVLNLTDASELKYQIIKDGRLIFEKEPYAVEVEPKILHEYFDFVQMMKKHKLTKVS